MNKITMLALCMLMYGFSTTGQITKNNWMVGGNGGFSITKTERDGTDILRSTNLRVTPNVGYFVLNKFAVGLSGLLDYQKQKTPHSGSASNSQTYYSLGPFARYYFLSAENQINIFSEASYYHAIAIRGKSHTDNFSLLAGAVLFVNSSVGIEFTGRYSKMIQNAGDLKHDIFQLGLGFQIHLERDR